MPRFTRSALRRVVAIAAIAAWQIALVSHASAQTPTPTPRPFPVGMTRVADWDLFNGQFYIVMAGTTDIGSPVRKRVV